MSVNLSRYDPEHPEAIFNRAPDRPADRPDKRVDDDAPMSAHAVEEHFKGRGNGRIPGSVRHRYILKTTIRIESPEQEAELERLFTNQGFLHGWCADYYKGQPSPSKFTGKYYSTANELTEAIKKARSKGEHPAFLDELSAAQIKTLTGRFAKLAHRNEKIPPEWRCMHWVSFNQDFKLSLPPTEEDDFNAWSLLEDFDARLTIPVSRTEIKKWGQMGKAPPHKTLRIFIERTPKFRKDLNPKTWEMARFKVDQVRISKEMTKDKSVRWVLKLFFDQEDDMPVRHWQKPKSIRKGDVRANAKAMARLETLAKSDGPISAQWVRELKEMFDLSRATVYRLIAEIRARLKAEAEAKARITLRRLEDEAEAARWKAEAEGL